MIVRGVRIVRIVLDVWIVRTVKIVSLARVVPIVKTVSVVSVRLGWSTQDDSIASTH